MKTINKSKKRPKTKPNKKKKQKKKKKSKCFSSGVSIEKKSGQVLFFLVVSYVVIIANLIRLISLTCSLKIVDSTCSLLLLLYKLLPTSRDKLEFFGPLINETSDIN